MTLGVELGRSPSTVRDQCACNHDQYGGPSPTSPANAVNTRPKSNSSSMTIKDKVAEFMCSIESAALT